MNSMWSPVEDGEHIKCNCGEPGCEHYISPDGSWLFMHCDRDMSIYLSDNQRLCQLVPTPPCVPAEIDKLLRDWGVIIIAVAATVRGEHGDNLAKQVRQVMLWLDTVVGPIKHDG